jgi:hypothetical protein
VKIYKKALQLSKDYQASNIKLIQNLTKVVESVTEQINLNNNQNKLSK